MERVKYLLQNDLQVVICIGGRVVEGQKKYIRMYNLSCINSNLYSLLVSCV